MSDLSVKFNSVIGGIKTSIGEALFKIVMAQLLTKENIILALNWVLDMLEDLAKKTDTKLDDEAIAKIREILQNMLDPK